MAVQGSKKRYGCEYHATFDIVELKLAGKHCTRISSSSYDKHLIEGQSGIDRPTGLLLSSLLTELTRQKAGEDDFHLVLYPSTRGRRQRRFQVQMSAHLSQVHPEQL